MRILSQHHVIQLLLFLWSVTNTEAQNSTLVKPGCQDSCGDVAIPYPFGIEKSHCYMNQDFAVTCNETSDGSFKPFLKSIGMELLGVSFSGYGYVRVNNSVISSNCSSSRVNSPSKTDLSRSSFVYSSYHNKFTVMGCDNYAKLIHNDSVVGGCWSICSDSTEIDGCFGIGCCQTIIPQSLNSFEANMSHVSSTDVVNSGGCKAAFMVDQEWFDTEISRNYATSVEAMKQREYIPAVLEWGYDQGSCFVNNATFCNSNKQYWWEEIDQNHICVCNDISSYTPYSDPIDYIDRSYGEGCNATKEQTCTLFCIKDSARNYNCSCPEGYNAYSDGTCFGFYITRPSGEGEKNDSRLVRVSKVFIGFGSGIGSLMILMGAGLFSAKMKQKKALKMKQNFFKRNGGLLLEQQLRSSRSSNIQQIKVFNSNELEKATDNFHMSRVIGRGGQGTVYKGMLTDGRIVAVKKSKVIDEDKLDDFINEVVILSQINHRNVVKLFGCCLEAEVPLLVYEFVPNGTLSQQIHHLNQDFPITWEMRLRIATEMASALAYLHSAASVPIYHRDIKSSNILLDDKYRAKVSDFGISKSISIDQTHVTTRVQGTFGYLDPEYFQSSQFSEKSDVYSFGIVLIELLTGQKPVFKILDEDKNLGYYFLESMEEDRLFDILDARVAKEATEEEIMAMSNIAKSCLNLQGKSRPTMKIIAKKLEDLYASRRVASIDDKHDDEEVDDLENEAS